MKIPSGEELLLLLQKLSVSLIEFFRNWANNHKTTNSAVNSLLNILRADGYNSNKIVDTLLNLATQKHEN